MRARVMYKSMTERSSTPGLSLTVQLQVSNRRKLRCWRVGSRRGFEPRSQARHVVFTDESTYRLLGVSPPTVSRKAIPSGS
jgi:hypothetical protein